MFPFEIAPPILTWPAMTAARVKTFCTACYHVDMCLVCSSFGIPVCTGPACSPQALDVVKMVLMSGGAGAGLVTSLVSIGKKSKAEKTAKKNDQTG